MRLPAHTARPTRADHALEHARREAADALRHGLDACEATRAQLAAGIDCSPARLAQMVDAADDATICVAAHLVAIADGIVTRDEGARLVREVDEAIRELLRLRALGEAAVREGVVGVEVPQ